MVFKSRKQVAAGNNARKRWSSDEEEDDGSSARSLEDQPDDVLQCIITYHLKHADMKHGKKVKPWGDLAVSKRLHALVRACLSACEGVLADDYECSVCWEKFGAVRPPHVLACNHAFCRACLVGHVRTQGGLSAAGVGVECPLCRTFNTEVVEARGMIPCGGGPITLLPVRCIALEHMSMYTLRDQHAVESQLAAQLDADALATLRVAIQRHMRKEMGGGGERVWWSCLASSLLRQDGGGRAGLREGAVISDSRIGRCGTFALQRSLDPVYVRCAAAEERTHDVAWRELCRRASTGGLKYTRCDTPARWRLVYLPA